MIVLDKIVIGGNEVDNVNEHLLLSIDGKLCYIEQEGYGYRLVNQVNPKEVINCTHNLLNLRERLDAEALRYIIRASIIDLITLALRRTFKDGECYRLCDEDIDEIEDFIERQSNHMLHIEVSSYSEVKGYIRELGTRVLFSYNDLIVSTDRGSLIVMKQLGSKLKVTSLPSYLIAYLNSEYCFDRQLEYLISVQEYYKLFGLNIRHLLLSYENNHRLESSIRTSTSF